MKTGKMLLQLNFSTIKSSELESEESRLTFQRDSHKAHDRLSMLTVAINRDKQRIPPCKRGSEES